MRGIYMALPVTVLALSLIRPKSVGCPKPKQLSNQFCHIRPLRTTTKSSEREKSGDLTAADACHWQLLIGCVNRCVVCWPNSQIEVCVY